jgi:hypothetical protein
MRSFLIIAVLAALAASPVWAKLPPPSEEAKAKAAEASAKSAWGGKVAAYQLCKAMDRTAAAYFAAMKAAGKEAKPPTATAACVDPGPYSPSPAAAPAAAAPAQKS